MGFILSQIFGGITLIAGVWSYFVNNRKTFFLLSIVSNIFSGLSFAVVGAFTAGINTFISITRSTLFYLFARYDKKPQCWIILIYAPIYLTIGIIFYNDYLDIIPMITPIIFTFSILFSNMQTMKKIMIFPNIMLIYYSLMNQVYTTSLRYAFHIIMLMTAIIKNYYTCKNNDKISEEQILEE